MLRTPRYDGLEPSSNRASIAARGSSRKPTLNLSGIYERLSGRKNSAIAKTDMTYPVSQTSCFGGARLVIFVDGDFWHGNDWRTRKAKLERGHNPDYWMAKIQRNHCVIVSGTSNSVLPVGLYCGFGN